jgi:hypothetical protein
MKQPWANVAFFNVFLINAAAQYQGRRATGASGRQEERSGRAEMRDKSDSRDESKRYDDGEARRVTSARESARWGGVGRGSDRREGAWDDGDTRYGARGWWPAMTFGGIHCSAMV